MADYSLKPPFCIVRYSDKAMLSAYNAFPCALEWTHIKDDAFTFARLTGEFSAQSYVNEHISELVPGVTNPMHNDAIDAIGIIEFR